MATASSSQANSAEKVTGPVRVVMPDQNGSFQLNAPRGAVQRVQVVDVDMVLHMADGTKVVLAGGAMEAMDDKSKVKFSDTSADTGRLLDSVGKIALAPNDQSRVLNSDPVAAADRAATDSTVQSQQHVSTDRNAASVGSDGISQLAKIISDNSGSLTTNGVQTLSVPTQPTADASTTSATAALVASQSSSSSDAPVRPVEVQTPPERQGVIPPTVVIDPSAPTQAIKLVNLGSTSQVGTTLYGSAGLATSATDASLPQQFSTQVINATNDITTIHAVGNDNSSLFVKVFNVNITGTGNVLSVVISGVPSNMTVLNGTDLGGGKYQISVASGQKDFNIQLQYSTVEADPSSPVHQSFDLTFTTVVATSNGQLTLNDSRHVAVKDASAYGDLNYLDPATGDAVLVLPAQGTPHEIHAGNNAGTTIYGSNANDLLYGGTGNDTLYGGTGNTFFEGGAGADRIVGGVNSNNTNVNTASYAGSGSGVTVDLVTGLGTGGDAQGDVLSNIQNLKGSAYDDTFVASEAANRFDGGTGGVDTVSYAHSTTAVTVNLVTGAGSGGYAQGDTYTHIQNVIGSAYSDVFIANGDANKFDGGSGGSDTVSYANSGAGVTVNLLSGQGSGGAAAGDTYVHIQNVIGSAYNDIFVGNADANSFDGGSGGNDTVSYAGSAQGVSVNLVTGRGTGGNADGDTYNHIQNVIGSGFDDVFFAGPDSIKFDGGTGGSDTVNYSGSTSAVTVNMITMTGSGGYAQNNVYVNIQNIVGSSYNDTFIASDAHNKFDGGQGGFDTVSYASSNAGVTVDLYNGTGTGGYADGDTLVHIQNVIGSTGNDLFIASADANNFEGGGGINTVSYEHSGGGVTIDLTSTIGAGTGGYYAAGDSFSNIQNLIGSVWDDVFVASAAANSFDGGTGSLHNRVSYAASDQGVTVDLNYTNGFGTSGGYADGDKLVNVQDLTGSNFNDTFVASAAANNFEGGGGSNTVSYKSSNLGVTVDLVTGTGSGGYADNDTYANIQNATGSALDDLFIANNSVNAFDGLGGNNTVSYAKASDGIGVTVDLVNGIGTNGFADQDTYANIQNVIGSAYDDTFVATNVKNVFTGLQGSDTVSYAYSDQAVTVDFVNNVGTGGYAQDDVYVNIENAVGSRFDDLFYASADANKFDGGVSAAGAHNRVNYSYSTAGVKVDLYNNAGGDAVAGQLSFANGDTYVNIQDVTGSIYDDIFYASADANKFDGWTSTSTSHNRVDYTYSTNGVKVDLFNNTGSDAVAGQVSLANGDTYANIQDATGGAADDIFVASLAANKFDGGVSTATSHNVVDYSHSTAGVKVDLVAKAGSDAVPGQGSYANGDVYVNIQDAIGSSFDDIFVASAAANKFDGGASATGAHNRVDYSTSTAGVAVDLVTNLGGDAINGAVSYANGDVYVNIQDVTGSTGFDDIFYASSVANRFDGANSGANVHNRVDYSHSTAGVKVDLVNNVGGDAIAGVTSYANGDTYANIQDATGTSADDIFVASADANKFDGGASAAGAHNLVDYSYSTNGVKVDLVANTGGDAVAGQVSYANGDTYVNIQDVKGGAADDIFYASAAANKFDGGVSTATSHNRVDYSYSTTGVKVDLFNNVGSDAVNGVTSLANGDTYINIQDATGGVADDIFVASAAANKFDGGTSTATSHNVVDYSNSTKGVKVDLVANQGSDAVAGQVSLANGDTYANIQDAIGSSSDDIFVASLAANKFDGGASTATSHNRVDYTTSSAGVTVNLVTNLGGDATGTVSFANGDVYVNIQDATGSSAYDDIFYASAAANNFDGGNRGTGVHNRVDYSYSTAGVKVDLFNRVGGDAVAGQVSYANGDTYTNIQDATGTSMDDIFVASSAANKFDGGASALGAHNVVDYSNSTAGVTVNLVTNLGGDATGTVSFANGDVYVNIQDVIGSQYDDVFVASAVANKFDGGVSATGAHNRVDYSNSAIGVKVDLFNNVGGDAVAGQVSYANGDVYVNIQDATGGAGNDIFVASAAANKFDGGASPTGAHNVVDYSNSTKGVKVDLINNVGSDAVAGQVSFASGDTYVNIQDVIGSAFDDTFVASSAANNFEGGAGSNTVSYAGSGAVFVNLSNASGTATFNGTSTTVAAKSAIGGNAVNDTYSNIQNIIGSSNADVLIGSSDTTMDTVLTGGAGNDIIMGAAGNGARTYTNYAGAGSGVTVNFLTGQATGGSDVGTDTLSNVFNVIGTSFSDTFIADGNANIFNGGAGGSDTVSYVSSASAVTVDLSNTATLGIGGLAAGDKYINIANVIGSANNDTLTGAAAGRSDLIGGGGVDNLFAATGNVANTYANYSTSGTAVVIDLFNKIGKQTAGANTDATGDLLHNIENVVGSAYDDVFYASGTAGGNKFEGGGHGTYGDTVDYSFANDNNGVTVDLFNGQFTGGGFAAGDTFINIQNVVGTAYNDTFYGSSDVNHFDGGAGSDTVNYSHSNIGVTVNLATGLGSDAVANTNSLANGDVYVNIENVVGSTGNDTFIASSAANAFDGGGGNDTVSYDSATANSGDITVTLANAGSTGTGSGGYAAGDTYKNISNVIGSSAVNTTIHGNNAANTLTAKGDNTTNYLDGGGATSGQDTLDGQLGGHNTLVAGSGTNVFIVSAGGGDNGIVNQATHTANLDSASGGAGTTTFQINNLSTTLTLSNFSSKVSGITTLDISSSTNTNVLVTTQDIVNMAQTSNHLLNIKMTGTESLQILNGSNYKILGTGDYVFYSDTALLHEVARIHITLAT